MDQRMGLLLEVMAGLLKLQAINERRINTCEETAKTLREMRADQKAKGMTANSSSDTIPPVPHISKL